MSSHYDPIPTDSDGEDDHVSDSVSMTGDDARSDRTRSTDRTNFFLQPRAMATDSEPEEDPEEDDPPNVDHRRPVREREPTPYPHQCTHSRFTDPYVKPNPAYEIWERTRQTLKRWRDGIRFTSLPTEEDISTTDSLLDTNTIIVEQVTRHEDTLDMMENIIMGMPGDDAFEGMQERVKEAEDNVSYVNDEMQSLRARVEAMSREFQRMDHSIHKMERQMGECHTMTAMAIGTHEDILREFLKREKDNQDNPTD